MRFDGEEFAVEGGDRAPDLLEVDREGAVVVRDETAPVEQVRRPQVFFDGAHLDVGELNALGMPDEKAI